MLPRRFGGMVLANAGQITLEAKLFKGIMLLMITLKRLNALGMIAVVGIALSGVGIQ